MILRTKYIKTYELHRNSFLTFNLNYSSYSLSLKTVLRADVCEILTKHFYCILKVNVHLISHNLHKLFKMYLSFGKNCRVFSA